MTVIIAGAGVGGLTLADLEARCQFGPGSFARLSPWNGDPKQGQQVSQLTSAVGRTNTAGTAARWIATNATL